MPLFLRRLRRPVRLLPRVATLVLIAVLAALGTVVVTAQPASAAPAVPPQRITLCLANAPEFCADVKNSVNQSGTPIWLYRARTGAKDYLWYYERPTCGVACIPECALTVCVAFVDVQNTNLCLAAAATQGTELIACHLLEGGTARALWKPIGNHFRNVFWVGLDLTVSGPLQDKRYLYVAHSVAPGTNAWQAWVVRNA
jgi:hypothetical protein